MKPGMVHPVQCQQVKGWHLKNRNSIAGRGRRCSSLQRVQIDSEAYRASNAMGTAGTFPGLQRPGRKFDHSPAPSVEVKNECSFNITPQYAFMEGIWTILPSF
jgi:hypothetical protein